MVLECDSVNSGPISKTPETYHGLGFRLALDLQVSIRLNQLVGG